MTERPPPDGLPAAAERWLTEQAPLGLACSRLDGVIVTVNATLCGLLGTTREAVAGRTLAELTHPDDRAYEGDQTAELVRGARDGYTAERRLVRADGTAVWTRITAFLVRDPDGRPAFVARCVEDIHDQRALREEHRAAEHELLALSTLAPVGMFRTDAQGRCVFVNAQWTRITGRTLAEALGDGWTRAIHPGDAERVAAAWRDTLEHAAPLRHEHRMLRPDGRVRWVLVQAIEAIDPRGARTFVGTITDLTERKAAEEELERTLRYHDVFVGVLGHDLGNPLSAILGAAELGQLRRDPDLVRTLFERIESSGRRMKRMIEQLLDVTRIRAAGGLELERAEVDLAAICLAAIDELRGAHEEAAIAFDVAGRAVGSWDADRLTQLVSNLIGNAVEHAAGARGVVVALDGTDPATVTLRVHNEGAVPPEILPTLFEPFRRAATRRKSAGLGLGLYITQQIALAHGGSVVVDSDPQHGTTFTATLPRTRPARGSRPTAEMPIIERGPRDDR